MPSMDSSRPRVSYRQPSQLQSRIMDIMRTMDVRTLLAGLAIGLCLGLFIGWVVWPVEWTNAWPSDLSPEAKAQYLATVAEAYVYYSDDVAAETARARLYDLDLETEIPAAQRWFMDTAQRNARIHVTNLGLLAQRLNVQSPDIIVEAPPVQPEAAPVAETPVSGAASDTGSSASGWLNWLLVAVAAILLVGGGLYILNRLARNRQLNSDADDADGFEDEGFDDFEDEDEEETRYARSAILDPTTDVGAGRASNSMRTRSSDDYDFDDENEDSNVIYSQGAAIHDLNMMDENVFDDDIIEGRPSAPGIGSTPPSASRQASSDHFAFMPRQPEATVRTSPVERQPAPSARMEPAAVMPAAAPRLASRTAAAPGKTIATFVAHYQSGLTDYDQSFNIVEPESGRYIGECGMGINMKNGVLQNNPDNVIALDVWLFDKKVDKSLSNQTRVLLSEYVIDNDLEHAFTRERPNDPTPVVAQPGVYFQLRGPNLVLDCQIIEATYVRVGSAAGSFQNVKIEMTVRTKEG